MAARVTAFVVFAIVAVTFVAGLIVGAQRDDDSGPVDLIVYNGRVYTGDSGKPFAEAIAVRGNRILRVGSNREIKRLMRRATTVIDAHGGSVTAGFHDGRVDLKAAGLALERTSLAQTPEAPPAEDAAKSGVGAAGNEAEAEAGAIVKRGAAATPSTDPSASIEAIAKGDTLEAIRRAIGAANRVGVTSVDVTAMTPDDLLPYDTMLRTRELTARVTAALPAEWPLDEAGLARLDSTRKRYEDVPFFKVESVRLIVSDHPVQTAPATAASSAAARRASRAAKATAVPKEVAAATRIADLARTIALLEQRGWQIILQTSDEGDVELALAALESIAPSSGEKPRDAAAANPTRRLRLELASAPDAVALARATRLGAIASIPKPAPAARTSALVARANVGTSDPAGVEPDRAHADRADVDRGEGAVPADATIAATTDAADAAAMSATPADAAVDLTAVDDRSDERAGDDDRDRDAKPWPYASLLASPAPFVFHSNWPLISIDPRFALSAVLLDAMRGPPAGDASADASADASPATSTAVSATSAVPDPKVLAARLSRAIDAYTRHAAFAAADDDQQGTIAKGLLADLVIFSTDLFTLPPDKLLDAEVTTTIFDGKVIYTAQPEPDAVSTTQ